MRKQVFGRQFKRDTNERKALFKGLASALVMHERIETTEEKAKAIKGHVEKLVTKAKKNESAHAKALLEAYLTHDALQKMLTDIAPRFVDRPGGYTRLIKLGTRFSDNASMAILEFVEKAVDKKVAKVKSGTTAQPTLETASTAEVAKPTRAKKTAASSDEKETKKPTAATRSRSSSGRKKEKAK